jgi:carboxylate-amine ligase
MTRLHLFDAVGIELEYMVVDRRTLAVRPIVDELFRAAVGAITSDVEHDDITWSNELVAHVVELKTTRPAHVLSAVAQRFHDHVQRLNRLAAGLGAALLPTAMHPWMDPHHDTSLWPHDNSAIYGAFNRIFDCRGHGWANLQSMHINLPFEGDEEFGRLHAAVRLLLPILPALAASSPMMDGRLTGTLDNRLAVYRTNSARVPSVAGRVIPEPVFTRGDYERQILGRIYADLAPHDPDGLLRDEFANARGAIARFGRGSIEIRVLDVQECPAADLAIAAAVVETLRVIVSERWLPLNEQQAWPVEPLAAILDACIRDADAARITDTDYLRAFDADGPRTAGELWRHIATSLPVAAIAPFRPTLGTILDRGPLARRIAASLRTASPAEVYGRLARCLADNRLFTE